MKAVTIYITLKYIAFFGFLAILIIVNAKLNVKLRTSQFPKFKKKKIPGCKVPYDDNDVSNSNIENDNNNNNNSNNDNSINSIAVKKNYSKYTNDPDYNKFYWGNN